MRVIALEEHWGTPIVGQAIEKAGIKLPPGIIAQAGPKLTDIGAGRITDMDAAGVDVQVLSISGSAGLDQVAVEEATAVARETNDILADATAQYPERLAGFALLATQDPEGAAAELERCVNKFGFKGVMINGTTNGLFLDDPKFEPILAQAEKLNVPIYLHPAPAPMPVYDAYFTGLPGDSGKRLYTAGWGWHVETGLHVLRMVLAGVFDRFPNLQIIIGHMGENLPFSLARADGILTKAAPHLKRRVGDYLLSNIHLTTSGYFTIPPLLCAMMTFGADRIMFSVDYPYSSNEEAMVLLDTAPLNPTDLAKIAHGNADRLLKL